MCSNKQKLVSEINSLNATDVLSEIELWDEKLYLFKSIWLSDIAFFKRYLNSTWLYEKDFEEFASTYEKSTSTSPDFFIQYFSYKVISRLPRIDKIERMENINKVNQRQKKDLLRKFCIWNDFWEDVRNLVLYFRMQSMPEFEFQIIFQALQSLISIGENSFPSSPTHLFNKLMVVSRWSQNIPQFTKSHYIDVVEKKFREIMTLWSKWDSFNRRYIVWK